MVLRQVQDFFSLHVMFFFEFLFLKIIHFSVLNSNHNFRKVQLHSSSATQAFLHHIQTQSHKLPIKYTNPAAIASQMHTTCNKLNIHIKNPKKYKDDNETASKTVFSCQARRQTAARSEYRG